MTESPSVSPSSMVSAESVAKKFVKSVSKSKTSVSEKSSSAVYDFFTGPGGLWTLAFIGIVSAIGYYMYQKHILKPTEEKQIEEEPVKQEEKEVEQDNGKKMVSVELPEQYLMDEKKNPVVLTPGLVNEIQQSAINQFIQMQQKRQEEEKVNKEVEENEVKDEVEKKTESKKVIPDLSSESSDLLSSSEEEETNEEMKNIRKQLESMK